MLRLTGAPASKETPKDVRPLFFTDNEKDTALAIANDLHVRGHRVRLVEYSLGKNGLGSFRALFDSQARSRRRPQVKKVA